jgi:hypothetical protein
MGVGVNCSHIARRFYVRPSGVIVWQCLNCGEWNYSRSWNDFDGVPASHKYKDAVK